jgi:hypothetical protein
MLRPPAFKPAAFFFLLLALGCGGAEPEAQPAPTVEVPAAPPDDPGQGKWRPARTPTRKSPAREAGERSADVQALPYLQGYRPAEDLPTISEHDPGAVSPGLNLYVSGHAAEAVLMDMEGRVLHRWRYPLRRLWPDLAADPNSAKLEYWRRAYLYPNGDLLGIYEGQGIVKLDARSNVLWSHRGGIHHDLAVTESGEIWALDREGKVIPRIHREKGVLEDMIAVLDPRGRLLRKISLLGSFERSPYAALLRGVKGKAGDVFHTNTLEVLDGRHSGRGPAFRRGNVLVSVRELSALAVVDPDREAVVWARTGSWRRQHQPTFLANGNLLLFDNQGAGGSRSRVFELDPVSGEIGWRYGGGPEVDFFSRTLGSCQRLPNGNTLITESENGRAVEVTPEGRTVWEFHNPHRAGDRGELVAVLFEVVRLPADFPFRGFRVGQGPAVSE